jgi:hypothetical protein
MSEYAGHQFPALGLRCAEQHVDDCVVAGSELD